MVKILGDDNVNGISEEFVKDALDGKLESEGIMGTLDEQIVTPAKQMAEKYPIQAMIYGLIAITLMAFISIRCYRLNMCSRRRQSRRNRRKKQKAYYQLGKRNTQSALEAANAFADSKEAFINDQDSDNTNNDRRRKPKKHQTVYVGQSSNGLSDAESNMLSNTLASAVNNSTFLQPTKPFNGPIGLCTSELSTHGNNGSLYGDDTPYIPSTRESSYVVGEIDMTGSFVNGGTRRSLHGDRGSSGKKENQSFMARFIGGGDDQDGDSSYSSDQDYSRDEGDYCSDSSGHSDTTEKRGSNYKQNLDFLYE